MYHPEDFRQTLIKAFEDGDDDTSIVYGAPEKQNRYLVACWVYASRKGWLHTITLRIGSETLLKGYLTPTGRKELGLCSGSSQE